MATAWRQVVDEIEQRRSALTATLLIAARLLPVLQDRFGRHCRPLDTIDDGKVHVQVAAPMALSIAQELAGWGADIDVIEPESVRAELARLGAELIHRYG